MFILALFNSLAIYHIEFSLKLLLVLFLYIAPFSSLQKNHIAAFCIVITNPGFST